MKRLLWLLSAALLLAGCAEESTRTEESNPYLPIAGLSIPREAAAGVEITISGVGFAEDCRIALQLNGSSEIIPATVISADNTHVTFSTPTKAEAGFYAIILTQDGKTTRIGGINITASSYDWGDFEIYVLAGQNLDVHAASVSKQIYEAEALPDSRTKHLEQSGYVEAMADGRLYFASNGLEYTDGWLLERRGLGCYNMITGKRSTPEYVDDLFAIGQVDGEFCTLRHYIPKPWETTTTSTYTLQWHDSGKSMTFDFAVSGIGATKINSRDMRFVHHPDENVILLCGALSGDVQDEVSLVIDLEDQSVYRTGNNPDHRYAYIMVGHELYCFASEYTPISFDATGDGSGGEIVGLKVLRITDVRNWRLGASISGAELVCTVPGVAISQPVYSPVTGLVYGAQMGQEGIDLVMSFNPQSGKMEGRRWIMPGIGSMFYFDPSKIPAK